jgi:hypothetical protein
LDLKYAQSKTPITFFGKKEEITAFASGEA